MNARPSACSTRSQCLAMSLGPCSRDEAGDFAVVLTAQCARRKQTTQRTSCSVEDALPGVHPIEDLGWHVRMDPVGHVLLAEDGIEADGMQVDDIDGVTGGIEAVRELLENGVAERCRILMGEHGQDEHAQVRSIRTISD